MQSKTIFILLMVFALASLSVWISTASSSERFSLNQNPSKASLVTARGTDLFQAKKADDRALPKQLSENEVQSILKQTEPKSHVEATLKISEGKIGNAIKNVQAGQYESAVEDVDVYASLLIYADDYTRKLPDSQKKDRNNCLKKIEQAIMKQTRNLDTVTRGIPFDYREPLLEKIGQVKKIRLRALDDVLGGGKFIHSSNQR